MALATSSSLIVRPLAVERKKLLRNKPASRPSPHAILSPAKVERHTLLLALLRQSTKAEDGRRAPGGGGVSNQNLIGELRSQCLAPKPLIITVLRVRAGRVALSRIMEHIEGHVVFGHLADLYAPVLVLLGLVHQRVSQLEVCDQRPVLTTLSRTDPEL